MSCLRQMKDLPESGSNQKSWWRRNRVKGVLGLFFMINSWMLWRLPQDQSGAYDTRSPPSLSAASNVSSFRISVREEETKVNKPPNVGYQRLWSLARHALAEGHNKPEPRDLWKEPLIPASVWKPCAHQRNWQPSVGNNGYMMVTANGGMNQQRVAICNAVAVARLLNATLLVPKFMYSSVWKDTSQFDDIYQVQHFIDYLTPDVRIVKELPKEIKSLDLQAIGSVITDVDIMKEAKPSFYLENILPILIQNGVVHFLGFGNRLAFDPMPFELQRLRCRCNFHALEFVPKIQQTGALLLRKLRRGASYAGPLDHHLVGPFAEAVDEDKSVKSCRYLALHLRFEIDMVAHSLCEFGGGEEERRELEAYREVHFPNLKNTTMLPPPEQLRSQGLCPLTPEEAVLMLAALGFNRKTRIFVAGAQIYGGKPRLDALANLYPKLVTKETLLSSTDLEPFMNFSSQLATLDFIACSSAATFAMTDSGSQLSSLVSGYRIYYGGGRMPTIRPNKRRLASIFIKNNTIQWHIFEVRMRKAIRQAKHVLARPKSRSVYRLASIFIKNNTIQWHIFEVRMRKAIRQAKHVLARSKSRSVYRYPRCKQCMCKKELASIFIKNNTIQWHIFEVRMRKAIRQAKHVLARPKSRSVYRYPRCKQCMCKKELASIFIKNNTIQWHIFEVRMRKAIRQAKHVLARSKSRSVYRYPRCKQCMCKKE